MEAVEISWTFYGYVTPAGGKHVQEWFDGLLEEERDEIKDVLGHLQKQPQHLWGKDFEAFDAGISEVKFKVNVLNKIYRIYGTCWPKGERYSYTFLVGKNKKEDNDRRGKKEAVERLKRLRSGEARIHEFKFEKEFDRQIKAQQGGSQAIH